MMGQKEFVALVGALLLASTAIAQDAKQGTAPATTKPLTKFITPIKGEVQVEYLPPQANWKGDMLITKFKVKNVSTGPIAGFKVDEYWYNKKGEPVSGSRTFRVPKPMMPGDVVEVLLESPRKGDMATNAYIFGHANGTVKPKRVPKFSS